MNHEYGRYFCRAKRRIAASIAFSLMLCATARASSVLLVKTAGSDDSSEKRFQLAGRFYGIEINALTIASPSGSAALERAMKERGLLGLVFAPGALKLLDISAVKKVLQASELDRLPLMVIASGVDGEKDHLSAITDGKVLGCKSIAGDSRRWEMTFSGHSELLHPLDGIAIESADTPLCALELASASPINLLETMRSGATVSPALVSIAREGSLVFVASAAQQIAKILPGSKTQLQQTFSALATPMIFLRSIAGERAWHLPEQDANLTIDDPWLTEPYGNLEYGALLREMQQHHFHTTIAFVPWNFDRGQSEVVDLFLNHPDLFSLSVHGNNHNHREFGAYSSQPLNVQAENLKQSIARMDRFQKMTGVPYDKVMVFPHAIAPAETFSLLNRTGFDATVNSENVPLGSKMPDDPLYVLRPWTLAFKGFLSIKRTSAEVPLSMPNVAINAFLGSPQLFYIHQEYFEEGIGAFDSTADAVNRIEPGIRWRSLRDIVRHLYLLRLRDDGDYDVCLLSRNLQLANPTDRQVTFHLFRADLPSDAHPAVLVDGASAGLQESSGAVRFDLVLGPHERRNVELTYGAERETPAVDIAKKSFLINLDRRLSDFRDMQLSRSHFGRMLQDLYYKHGIDNLEGALERRIAAIAILFTAGLILLLVFRRSRRFKAGTR